MNCNGKAHINDPKATAPIIKGADCPPFIAYAHEDSYVDADVDLDVLIKTICADKSGEDVVIWQQGITIAAIIRGGEATRFV